MKNQKDLAQSINSRLSQVAKKRDIEFLYILTEFLIERLVVRLQSNLGK